MIIIKKIALGSASLALVATPAMPVMAADMGRAVSVQSETTAIPADVSDNHRRHRRHRRHRGRVSGGDILTGIGILAGIAILADVASNSNKRDRRREREREQHRYPQPYPQDQRQSYPGSEQPNRSAGNGSDLGTAVNVCTQAAESRASNNARVSEIRSVTRDGNGWRVEGELSGGNSRGFSCGSTNGQVDFIQLNT